MFFFEFEVFFSIGGDGAGGGPSIGAIALSNATEALVIIIKRVVAGAIGDGGR